MPRANIFEVGWKPFHRNPKRGSGQTDSQIHNGSETVNKDLYLPQVQSPERHAVLCRVGFDREEIVDMRNADSKLSNKPKIYKYISKHYIIVIYT